MRSSRPMVDRSYSVRDSVAVADAAPIMSAATTFMVEVYALLVK